MAVHKNEDQAAEQQKCKFFASEETLQGEKSRKTEKIITGWLARPRKIAEPSSRTACYPPQPGLCAKFVHGPPRLL